ncbi:hypothetical protein LINGRAHAP2_LOCUS26922 [Linum grandiflorum]
MIKVEHLYWEGNRTADYLAGHGIGYLLVFIIFLLVILFCRCTFCMTCLEFLILV